MAEELNGLEYVGKCYDVLTIDPLNLGATGKSVNAIDIASGDVGTYRQGAFEVPKGATLQSPYNTEVETFHSMIYNSYDFQREFSQSLEVNAGISGLFEFSASGSFKEIATVSASRKRASTYAMMYVQNHIVTLDLDRSKVLRLGSAFAAAVEALPAERASDSDKRMYSDFAQRFGTHLVTRASLGGLAYSRVTADVSKVSSSMEREQEFKAGAKVEVEAFSAGSSASEARKASRKIDNEQEFERTQIVFRGGIGNTHEIAEDWSSGLKERPSPIPRNTELRRLSVLLTRGYFPDDAAIEKKQRLLDDATDEYIVSKGGILDGVVRYGDKLAMHFQTWDGNRQAYLSPKTGLVFRSPATNMGDLVAATCKILDAGGRWGCRGQEPHEILAGSDTQVQIQVEGGSTAGLIAHQPLRGSGAMVELVTDRDNPRTRWSLGLVDSAGAVSFGTPRALMSGDYLVLMRPEHELKGYLRVRPMVPSSQGTEPFNVGVQAQKVDPMYNGLENRGGSILSVRKLL